MSRAPAPHGPPFCHRRHFDEARRGGPGCGLQDRLLGRGAPSSNVSGGRPTVPNPVGLGAHVHPRRGGAAAGSETQESRPSPTPVRRPVHTDRRNVYAETLTARRPRSWVATEHNPVVAVSRGPATRAVCSGDHPRCGSPSPVATAWCGKHRPVPAITKTPVIDQAPRGRSGSWAFVARVARAQPRSDLGTGGGSARGGGVDPPVRQTPPSNREAGAHRFCRRFYCRPDTFYVPRWASSENAGKNYPRGFSRRVDTRTPNGP